MTSRCGLLASILLVGFAARVITTFVIPPRGAVELSGDAVAYHQIAIHVVRGEGFVLQRGSKLQPTAQVAGPIYPLFLAGVYKLVGVEAGQTVVRAIQVILGVWTCWLVYVIGRELFSSGIGLVAAALAAVYPPFLSHSYYGGPAFLLTENLSVPLLTASICGLVVGQAFLAGVALGGAILSRFTLLAFPAVGIAWLLWTCKSSLVPAIASFVLGVVLVITPWLVRNTITMGAPILSTHGGINFWYGNAPQARGGWVDLPLPTELTGGRQQDELLWNTLGYAAGWRALKANPARVPGLLARKAAVLWLPINDTNDDRHINWGFVLISVCAVYGWWKVRHEPRRWALLVAPAVYLTALTLVFFGDPRFRLPVEPLLLILAAAGLVPSSSSPNTTAA